MSHPIPSLISLLSLFALAGMLVTRYGRHFSTVLADYVTATNDLWSWTTQDGRTFEDVEIESVSGQEVILVHRTGRARLLISELSDESQAELFRSRTWPGRDLSSSVFDSSSHLGASSVLAEKKLKAA